MKKLPVALVLLCLPPLLFAFDLSAGIGTSVGGFWQATYFEPYVIIPTIWEYEWRRELTTTVPLTFSAYFDATYAVVSFGFQVNGSPHEKITTWDGSTKGTTEGSVDERAGFLSFSLLGRYPFTLGSISIFPLLGIEYDINLYLKAADGTDLKASLTDQERSDLNQFWFKTGVGADFFIYQGLYIRPELLMGFKLLTTTEREYLQNVMTTFDATTARTTDFVFEGGVQAGWRF